MQVLMPTFKFQDPLVKNLTKLFYDLDSDEDLAVKRFEEDTIILNFFFDTPIITKMTKELKANDFAKALKKL